MIGSISLFDYDGTLLQFAQYESASHRNRILKSWRWRVGPKFSRMYIQIAPGLTSRAKAKI